MYTINFNHASNLEHEKIINIENETYISKISYKDGFLYVMAPKERCIYQIDLEGKIIKSFGSKGEGPGELKYLKDFEVTQSYIVLSGNKKIIIFDKESKIINEYRKRNLIESLAISDENWFYIKNKRIFDKKKRSKECKYQFNLFNNRGKNILAIPNVTRQDAYNVAKGARLPFPWFPSPYCDRPIFVNYSGDKIAIFYTRRKYFSLIKGEKVYKIYIDYQFEEVGLTSKDYERFFDRIDPKPPRKTKESVIFPKTREYFQTVFNWDEYFALIINNIFILINEKGKVIEKIRFPNKIPALDSWDLYRPIGSFCMGENKLFYLHEGDEIRVFKYIKE